MIKSNLSEFVNGWFLGNFYPSIKHENFEVGFKRYQKGDREPRHHQETAYEISVVTYGVVQIGDEVLRENEILLIEPGEVASFLCIEDAGILVVKSPSLPSDKVLDE